MLRFRDHETDTVVVVEFFDDDGDDAPTPIGSNAAEAAAAIAENAIRYTLSTPGGKTNHARRDEPPRMQTGRGAASIRCLPTPFGFDVQIGPERFPYMWVHQHTGREFVRTSLVPIEAQLDDAIRARLA